MNADEILNKIKAFTAEDYLAAVILFFCGMVTMDFVLGSYLLVKLAFGK